MLEILFKKTCRHDKITPYLSAGYCPECGEHVQNHWFITRCSCCGMKMKSVVFAGKIKSISKFCPNCGCSEFAVSELEEIDVVNINYAVVIKKVVKHQRQSIVQTWMENNVYSPTPLLLGC